MNHNFCNFLQDTLTLDNRNLMPNPSYADARHIAPFLGYQCHVCLRVFTMPHALKRHMDSVHLKKATFSCDQCTKFYYRRDHLLQHKRQKHWAQWTTQWSVIIGSFILIVEYFKFTRTLFIYPFMSIYIMALCLLWNMYFEIGQDLLGQINSKIHAIYLMYIIFINVF